MFSNLFIHLFITIFLINIFRYQQFLTLVPSDPTVLMRIGNLYEEEGDKSQAFQYMYEVSVILLYK